MPKRFTLLALLALSAACGTEGEGGFVCSSTAAVVDGFVSSEERSTVAVARTCTGVLVGPVTVLTAAHCHADASYVRFAGEVVSVWDRIPHPDWTGGVVNDVEVLVLEEPLPGPYATIAAPEVGFALVQGYGYDEECNSGTLREAEVVFDVVNEVAAFTGPGPGSCYGDSGGPLYQGGSVVALTSHGRGPRCGDGSQNATLVHYREWLELVSPDELVFR